MRPPSSSAHRRIRETRRARRGNVRRVGKPLPSSRHAFQDPPIRVPSTPSATCPRWTETISRHPHGSGGRTHLRSTVATLPTQSLPEDRPPLDLGLDKSMRLEREPPPHREDELRRLRVRLGGCHPVIREPCGQRRRRDPLTAFSPTWAFAYLSAAMVIAAATLLRSSYAPAADRDTAGGGRRSSTSSPGTWSAWARCWSCGPAAMISAS